MLVTKNLIMVCLHDPKKYQVGALHREAFDVATKGLPIPEEKRGALWALQERALFTQEELISKLTPALPDAQRIFDVYEKGGFRGMSLTSVGIAIAHANLRRVSEFDADLSIWIK